MGDSCDAGAAGDWCQICVARWADAAGENECVICWDGVLLQTDYRAPVDPRWLVGLNRAHAVTWISADMESWFYSALLPALGVHADLVEQPATPNHIAANGGTVMPERDASSLVEPPGDRNPYDFAVGPVIANSIEQTQINKFHTQVGHGFAAEEANALHDRHLGRAVDQVGKANILNGADRVVDGVAIQTKYCMSPEQTVRAAFGAEGSYRYAGQQLEVPRDQYADCVRLMRDKIAEGKVPGHTNPGDAERIVKKGHVTYRQALNIARAGTVDGLIYDAKSQSVVSGYAFAISFCISFARAKWAGESTEDALAGSVRIGLEAGAKSFLVGVVTAQILRTRAAGVGTVASRGAVKSLAATKVGRKAVDAVAQGSLGKMVSGAAAQNHVAKLLRTSVVTSVVVTVVVTAPDFYRAAFRKSISWKQFTKNLAVNTAGVAGGAGGGMAGAAAGRAIGSCVPGGEKAGAVVGGLVGSLAGGFAASAATKYALDSLIEDDAKAMVALLPDCLEPLATEYMLSETEMDELIAVVQKRLDASFLRDMYRSESKAAFVRATFEPDCESITGRRPRVLMPPPSEVESLLAAIAEEAVA